MHGHGVNAVLKAAQARRSGCHQRQNAPHLALQIGGAAGDGVGDLWRGRLGGGVRRQQGLQLQQQRGVAVVLHGHGFHHRAAQLGLQARHVNVQPMGACHINHVERHHHRLAQALQLQHQAQVHAQIGGVHHGHDGVGCVFTRAAALQHVQHHLLVRRGRGQAVRAGQIDHRHALPIGQARRAHLALHGNASVIGHLLARAG